MNRTEPINRLTPTSKLKFCFFRLSAQVIQVLLIILSIGCASSVKGSPVYYRPSADQAPRSVFTVANDALILTRIKSKLFSDDLVDQGEIDIKVRHGVVFLEGSAQDVYHRRMITDLIQTVEGVVRVENRLNMILRGTRFVTPETLIRDQIRMALISDPELSRHPIAVKATADHIILSGRVGSQSQKINATAMAKEYAGDREVIDQLVVDN